jgi:hypothetical protein
MWGASRTAGPASFAIRIFAEPHAQRIEDQQAARQRLATPVMSLMTSAA